MTFKLATLVVVLAIGCGMVGGNVADRAVKAADGACACQEFECTRPFIQQLNRLSIQEEASAARKKIYRDAQLRGAECQEKLRK